MFKTSDNRLFVSLLAALALVLCIPVLGVKVQASDIVINKGAKDELASAVKIDKMVYIEGGTYTPLYKQNGVASQVLVKPFYMDEYQVTNQQFLQFIEQNPRWSREKIKPLFADSQYLSVFKDADQLDEIANKPVVNVSWFSAMAYCKDKGKSLPSVDEWEYVARASKTKINGTSSVAYREKILEWYSKPATNGLPDVDQTQENYWGIHGMHGVVWELVRDFNSGLVTGESRGDSALEKQLFCGAGATQSVDPSDYAAFMRYALRSSISATYTINSLGFRCATSVE